MSSGLSLEPAAFQNQLLQALSKTALMTLVPLLEPVTLKRRQPLEKAGHIIDYVYFPETVLGSKVATAGKLSIEVAIFGREGMSGTPLLLNDAESSLDSYAQVEGTALRVPAKPFSEFLQISPTSRGILRRYTHAEQSQMAYAVLASGKTTTDRRLARWLLMAHDRIPGDVLKVGHAELADMLGVRRPGVTTCLHLLEGKQLIKCSRSSILIVDRQGLHTVAGSAYGEPERQYQRLLGFPPGKFSLPAVRQRT